MFELSIALKYLVPRKRSLSTALISALSILVISLVVWLVLVFLSVTAGIEKNWLHRLTALHAPVRLSPTETYYNSYFYQIDALAAASNYTYKTIGEKEESLLSDPYASDLDAEIPVYWQKMDRTSDGQLRDPVKQLYTELSSLQKEVPGLEFQDYEISGALLRLTIRQSGSSLSQMSYLLSIPDKNPRFSSLLLPTQPNLWSDGKLTFPDFGSDAPVILPKSYRESGVEVGNRGFLQFVAQSGPSAQEQKIAIRVAGFYDPGVMAMGNKCILVPKEITRAIHAVSQTFSPDGTPTNGIFVWHEDISQADQVRAKITERLQAAGIAPYWKIATYEEFEFAKDLLQQFRSDRTLLLLIAAVILIVACSNIISLLVLLVNDKKKEIAILQSMGASFRSIAAIFGACGIAMGALSSLFGSALALFTLRHLDRLASALSALQGRAAFNPAFFGQTLPNELSWEALLFVLIATPLLSLAAGLIPALKASRIRPSSVLRSE